MGIVSLLLRGVTGSLFSWVPFAICGAALVGIGLLYYHAKASGRSDAEAGFVRAELVSQQDANTRLLSQVRSVEALASQYRARERERMQRNADLEARLRQWQDSEPEPGQCSPTCLLPPWLLQEEQP